MTPVSVALAAVPASIPSPSSGEISIGPFDLRAYGLMIALGVIAATWLFGRMLERKGVGSADDASAIGIWAVAGGVVGARLYHVVTDWDRFADDLAAIPQIWKGGLGIPGGLLVGVVVGIWQGKRRAIAPGPLLTSAAPAIPLAQAIGRWGNWFNQELFGKPTDLPWALEIDDAHNLDYASGTTFHPTFLYESLWNFGLVAVLLLVDRRLRLGPGRLFGVYVIGYGLGRFWIEGLRIDPSSELGGLRLNQWVALAAVVGGAIYLAATRGRTWPAPTESDDPDADESVIDEQIIEGADGADPGHDAVSLDAAADEPDLGDRS